MLDVVSIDDPWFLRLAFCVKRQLTTPARKLTAAALVSIVLIWLFFSALSFFNRLFDLDSNTLLDLEKSAHFILPVNDARSYEWLIQTETNVYRVNNLTGSVAESVVEARSMLKYAKQMVLVHDNYCDLDNSTEIDCHDAAAFPTARMTKQQAFYKKIQLQAYRFLSHNYQQRPCICGPLLGYNLRYIGVYAGSKENVKQSGDAIGGDADVASFVAEIEAGDTNADAIVVHMFNPVDEQAEIYDALDTSQMKEQKIGLYFSKEVQNYRYNTSRGSFTLLRRTRIRVAYQNEACQWLRPWLSGASALCAQECFDLMRGVDVRERARIQYNGGIVLNREYFTANETRRMPCRRRVSLDVVANGADRLHDEL